MVTRLVPALVGRAEIIAPGLPPLTMRVCGFNEAGPLHMQCAVVDAVLPRWNRR